MTAMDADRCGDERSAYFMTAQRADPSLSPAPWAEVVPQAPYPMTVGDLLAWPDDDRYRYEVVDGVLVRMAGGKPRALFIANRLYLALGSFVAAHGLGETTGADGVYDLDRRGQPNTGLLPDIGFIRADLLPHIDLDQVLTIPPDLAVEIASENQYRPAMARKARRYLDAGTRLVWIVYSRWQQVDVWRPGVPVPTTLGLQDTLDGEDVIPGFSYSVARLFG